MRETAKRIFKLTETLGISDYDLSKRSGVSSSTINDWRNSDINPGDLSTSRICRGLGITKSDLFSIEVDEWEPDIEERDLMRMKALCVSLISKGKSDYAISYMQFLDKEE